MALPTPKDNLHAMMYALDRMKRDRCEIASSQPNSGVEYKYNDQHRIYPCHSGLKDCKHGNCRINTKDKCDSISQLPFDDVSGKPIKSVSCNTDSDCVNNFTCDHKSKTCIPKNPYLEFRNGKCVYGNFALLKWCRFPTSRRAKKETGVTDVPPFNYNITTGKCEITKEYCDRMGVSYKLDSQRRPTCYTTTGQTVGEFFVGKTIFRGLKRGEGKPISKDFAGENVSLYLSDGKLSFNIDEVKQSFPELVTKNNYIEFTSEDLKTSS